MKRGPRKTRMHGELDQKKESIYTGAPGPVKIYTLPPEEVEKIFKGVEPTEKPSHLKYAFTKEAI